MLFINRSKKDIPDITVVILTYNHEDTITQALDSIIEQQHSLDVEILVHDDFSKDETVNLLTRYQKKHPEIITLALQESNQYDGGENPVLPNAIKLCKGSYIAICEGDDYWIDTGKLQKQFDLMQREPEVNGCFHPAYTENPLKERQIIAQHSQVSKVFSTAEVIKGDGGFCPTASLFIKKEALDLMNDELLSVLPCGDYFIQILASIKGGLAYTPEPMSVYRIEQNNSFSSNFVKVNWNKKAQFYRRMCDSLRVVDEITLGEYSTSIKEMIRRHNRSYKNHMKRALKEKVKSFLFRK